MNPGTPANLRSQDFTLDNLGFGEGSNPKTVQQENQADIDAETERQLSGSTVKTDDIFAACRANLNILAGTALPEVFEFMFPPMYLAIWNWLTTYANKTRDFSKLALGMPRGFAKTTLVKLFILYCILFTHRKFILIISSVESHGVNIITDVISMLREPNIIKVFGNFEQQKLERDTLNLKIFVFRGRRIVLGAIGAEGSIRGLNLGFDRPDVEIFDDFQTKEDSENDNLAKKLMTRMIGTIMKAKSPKGCLYLYVANMYPTTGSILRKLKDNPFWVKFIVGGILADGKSLWEELQPIKQLEEEFQNDVASGNGDVFFAEVLNDETAGLRSGVDISAIPSCPYKPPFDLPQGRFIIIDPANSKLTDDLNAVGYFEVFDGKPVFVEESQGHWNPLELIKQAVIMALRHRCSLIIVEDISYQASLLFWFNHICAENDLSGFFFEPIETKQKSKNARIKDMFKTLVQTEMAGRIVEPLAFIGPTVMPQFRQQIIAFNPMTDNNVDELLDLMAYTSLAMLKYSDLMATEFNIGAAIYETAQVLPAYATSPI
jgi:hypothetical protein